MEDPENYSFEGIQRAFIKAKGGKPLSEKEIAKAKQLSSEMAEIELQIQERRREMIEEGIDPDAVIVAPPSNFEESVRKAGRYVAGGLWYSGRFLWKVTGWSLIAVHVIAAYSAYKIWGGWAVAVFLTPPIGDLVLLIRHLIAQATTDPFVLAFGLSLGSLALADVMMRPMVNLVRNMKIANGTWETEQAAKRAEAEAEREGSRARKQAIRAERAELVVEIKRIWRESSRSRPK